MEEDPFAREFLANNASIMSGDSPTAHHHRDIGFELERPSSPTTSKDTGVQAGPPALPPPPPGAAGPAIVYASVAVDPAKDKEKDKEKEEDPKDDLASPILHSSEDDGREDERDRSVRLDEYSYEGKDRDKKNEEKKLNGDFDKLDGVYSLSRDRKQPVKETEDEDNCIVKCLYVTMQCCECNIM